jgi:hypothetical protein
MGSFALRFSPAGVEARNGKPYCACWTSLNFIGIGTNAPLLSLSLSLSLLLSYAQITHNVHAGGQADRGSHVSSRNSSSREGRASALDRGVGLPLIASVHEGLQIQLGEKMHELYLLPADLVGLCQC